MAQDASANQGLANADLSVAVKAIPSKAGTKQNPQGVTISAASKLTTERGVEPPIVTGIDLLLGRGFSWNGNQYVKCPKQVLDREGPRGCPNEAVMGSVSATARAGTINTKLNSTFFNGGAKQLFAYTKLEYPARVRETIVYTTAETTGKWRYKGTFRVPKNLQIVAGMPIQTTRMRLKLGGKPYAKDYITTTSCPKGGWNYQLTTHYLYDQTGKTGKTGKTGQDTINDTIPCTN